MPCRITVRLADGRVLTREKHDYEGFHTKRMPRERVVEKFEALTKTRCDDRLREAIVDSIFNLKNILTPTLFLAGKTERSGRKFAAGPLITCPARNALEAAKGGNLEYG